MLGVDFFRGLHWSYFRNPLQIFFVAVLCARFVDLGALFGRDFLKRDV